MKHYAGKVKYTIGGWVERNMDSIPQSFNDTLATSTSQARIGLMGLGGCRRELRATLYSPGLTLIISFFGCAQFDVTFCWLASRVSSLAVFGCRTTLGAAFAQLGHLVYEFVVGGVRVRFLLLLDFDA